MKSKSITREKVQAVLNEFGLDYKIQEIRYDESSDRYIAKAKNQNFIIWVNESEDLTESFTFAEETEV